MIVSGCSFKALVSRILVACLVVVAFGLSIGSASVVRNLAICGHMHGKVASPALHPGH